MTCKTKLISNSVLILVIFCMLTSCAGYNYINNAPINPQFRNKGSIKGNLNPSFNHMEASMAFSPIKNFGLTGSLFGSLNQSYSYEVSPLFWAKFVSDSLNTRGLYGDLQIGYGKGYVNSSESKFIFLSYQDEIIRSSNWEKIFINPSLYLYLPTKKKKVSHILNYGIKANFVNFFNISEKEVNYTSSSNKDTKYNFQINQSTVVSVFNHYFGYSIKSNSFIFGVQVVVTSNNIETYDFLKYDSFRINTSFSFFLEDIFKKQ